MGNRILARLAALALPALLGMGGLAGCASLHYHAQTDKPVLIDRSLNRPYKITQHFEDHGRRVYLLGGLVPVAGQDGADLLARYLNAGDGLLNISAQEKYGLLDQVISLLSAGLVSTRSVAVKGDVFIFTAPKLAAATPPPLPEP